VVPCCLVCWIPFVSGVVSVGFPFVVKKVEALVTRESCV